MRDQTYRVLKELQKIARRHGDKLLPVVMLTERGEAELLPLQALLAARSVGACIPHHRAGGRGWWTNTAKVPARRCVKEPAIGVAETGGKRARVIIRRDSGMYWHSPIDDYKAEEIESNNLDNGQIYASIREGRSTDRADQQKGGITG